VLSVTRHDGALKIAQTKAALEEPGKPVLVRFTDVGPVNPATGKTLALRVEPVEGTDERSEDETVERAKLKIIAALESTKDRVPVVKLLEAVKGFKLEVKKRALRELRASGLVDHVDGPRGSKLLQLARGGGTS
jgi:hypothetical protein